MKKENRDNFQNVRFSTAEDFGINKDIVLVSDVMVSQCVRVHLQNARQGTVGCKSRSDLISRSNKKPWKQKGTGKARAGTPRSPLWRGGGVCFGPQARTRVLAMPKKMNRSALLKIFLDLLDNKKVMSVNLNPVSYSAKQGVSFLKDNNLNEKKIIFLYDNADFQTYYSFNNIKNITMVPFDTIHAYAIANNRHIIYLEKDVMLLKDVVSKWLVE